MCCLLTINWFLYYYEGALNNLLSMLYLHRSTNCILCSTYIDLQMASMSIAYIYINSIINGSMWSIYNFKKLMPKTKTCYLYCFPPWMKTVVYDKELQQDYLPFYNVIGMFLGDQDGQCCKWKLFQKWTI